MKMISYYTKLINNYNLVAKFTRKNRIRGGVCIVWADEVSPVVELDLDRYITEGIIECCEVKVTALKLLIICVYRPTICTEEAFKTFFELLDSMLLTNIRKFPRYHVVVAGYFNINLLENHITSEFL